MYQDPTLPLTWVPTRGNEIPPLAVPLHVGSQGQLYVARALLDGEIYIGTTSFSSGKGARIRDRFGRNHDIFEYEVLTCGSNVRFHIGGPPPLAGAEVARSTSRRAVRHETPNPECTPPKTPGKLTPISWLSPRSQSPIISNEPRGEKYSNDPPPYTGSKNRRVEPPRRLRPISLNDRENVQFKYLAQSKFYAVVDDTPSMQYSWTQAREALSGVVHMLSSDTTWDGLNVRFLYHPESNPRIKTVSEFERVFDSVALWRGDKILTTKVSQVFAESLSLVAETPTPTPVVLLIVTDAMAIDTQELNNVIIRFCQQLNEKRVPNNLFRIHLLQMGSDRKAVKPIHDFRDRVTQRDRDRRILNVISYHRGRGLLNAQHIVKLLLASTDIPVEEDPDIGERQPAEVIESQYREVDRIRRLGNR